MVKILQTWSNSTTPNMCIHLTKCVRIEMWQEKQEEQEHFVFCMGCSVSLSSMYRSFRIIIKEETDAKSF